MRDAQVSIALRKGCPVDGNSVQKRSKSDECDFGRHDTYSSSGCAVAQEISLTYLSGLPRCFLGTWIYARPDRVGRKREVPVMAIRPATEVVNSCRKRNRGTKKRDNYERKNHIFHWKTFRPSRGCAHCIARVITTRREQEFSLGRVLGEPPAPADMAKSASTALFEGIKPTHGQSC
jgi:hypothetical protein